MRRAKLPPHLEFFGSLVYACTDLDVLKEYILHMDQSLHEAEAACATSAQAIPPSLEIVATDKSDLLADPFPRLLHAGFIISVVIFLEQQLTLFSQSLQRAEDLGLTIKDLSGSLIERFRKYCERVAHLPFSVSNENWEDLRGVLEIRNCLVHNNGLFEGFGKANTVEAFAKRHGTPIIEDGMLSVNTGTSLKVLDVVKVFVEAIHDAALGKYPEEKQASSSGMNSTPD